MGQGAVQAFDGGVSSVEALSVLVFAPTLVPRWYGQPFVVVRAFAAATGGGSDAPCLLHEERISGFPRALTMTRRAAERLQSKSRTWFLELEVVTAADATSFQSGGGSDVRRFAAVRLPHDVLLSQQRWKETTEAVENSTLAGTQAPAVGSKSEGMAMMWLGLENKLRKVAEEHKSVVSGEQDVLNFQRSSELGKQLLVPKVAVALISHRIHGAGGSTDTSGSAEHMFTIADPTVAEGGMCTRWAQVFAQADATVRNLHFEMEVARCATEGQHVQQIQIADATTVDTALGQGDDADGFATYEQLAERNAWLHMAIEKQRDKYKCALAYLRDRVDKATEEASQMKRQTSSSGQSVGSDVGANDSFLASSSCGAHDEKNSAEMRQHRTKLAELHATEARLKTELQELTARAVAKRWQAKGAARAKEEAMKRLREVAIEVGQLHRQAHDSANATEQLRSRVAELRASLGCNVEDVRREPDIVAEQADVGIKRGGRHRCEDFSS